MDFKPYTGLSARLTNPVLAAVLKEDSTISMAIYPKGTVDHQFFHDAVVLTDETADALYEDFTPLVQPYATGSRPFLEARVRQVTGACATAREKAIALLDWCRDLPYLAPEWKGEPFHGGTEEEVIQKSSNMCNEKARVLGIMAQIADLPSRYVGHMLPILDYDSKQGTGHGVNEIYLEGHWAYFDTSGKFYQKADGTLASTWDLIQNPALIDRQAPEVLRHLRKDQDQSNTRTYFSPTTVHIIVNYLARDHRSYDYGRVWATKEMWQRARELGRAIREAEHSEIFRALTHPPARENQALHVAGGSALNASRG